MASLGRSANASKMQAKRARSRLSGKTVPAATRAAQSVCVCIARPPLGIKACCRLLLSYYPLQGQRCEIVRIRRAVDPDLILRLADGSHAAMAMSWTAYGEPQGLPAAPSRPDLPQLDLQGLRQIVHLLDQLRQEDRFPTPRRRAPRSRSVHRKLPKVNTGSLRSD